VTRLCPEGEAVETWGGEGSLGVDGVPGGFVWHHTRHRITAVRNRWRIHTNWWHGGPIEGADSPLLAGTWREYLKVTTDTGLLCLLFRDMEAEAEWYLGRIYD
jgi:hypothetical protein